MHYLKPGDYTLNISHKEKDIRLRAQLPEKVKLERLKIDPFAGVDETNRPFARLTFIFNDPPEKVNYYEICISHKNSNEYYKLQTEFQPILSESYYPSVLNTDQAFPEVLPFSDKGFNGERVSIPIRYLHPIFPLNGNVELHSITIHFRTISEEYYKFKTSLLRHSYNTRPDIIYGQAEPLNVFSNNPDGYGFFGGYQSVDQTIIVRDNEIFEIEF